MSTIIFVGGSTASGKSTFAKELNKNLDGSFMYRRFQCFYDIAKFRNIPSDEIFDKVSSDEVDNFFLEKCLKHDYIISDVHYAVQLFQTKSNSEIDDKYYPTISNELINKFLNNDVKIICIYISCSPKECVERSNIRYLEKGKEIKYKTIEQAIIENNHENYEWYRLLNNKDILGIELDSENYKPTELVEQFINVIKEEKNNSKILKKANM